MPTLNDGVLYGLGILVLDFLAWRFRDRKADRWRLALRALMFGLSTYVLFSYGMNPLREAPWPNEPLRHLLARAVKAAQIIGHRLQFVLRSERAGIFGNAACRCPKW